MERRWQVIAIYVPLPRTVSYFDRGDKYRTPTSVKQELTFPGAGHEFKFTVRDAADANEAIEIVKRSGFFCTGLTKLFGFCAKEVA